MLGRAPIRSLPALALLLFVGAMAPPGAAAPTPDCLDPVPDAGKASASGEATGLLVRVDGQDVLDAPAAKASQDGPGRNTEDTELLEVRIPSSDEPLVQARILRTRADARVEDSPSLSAHARGEAWVADLNVLDGLVTARTLHAYANGHADPRTAVTDSHASTVQGLVVDGRQVTASEPATRIDLPAEAAGEGSHVILYDRAEASQVATRGDGTWVADVTVTMVHIWLADVPGVGSVEVIVSQAHARAASPTVPCGGLVQSVQGRAYNARFWPDGWSGPNYLHGWQAIGPVGGTAGQSLLRQDYHAGGLHFTSDEVATDVKGTLDPGVRSEASSSSDLANVCLRLSDDEPDCFLSARAVHAESYSTADATGAWSKGDSYLVDLRIAGTDVCAALGLEETCRPKPNTQLTIDGVKVTLNEQQPDWPMSGTSGFTTRAIRLQADSLGTVIIGYTFTSAEHFQP